MITAGRTGALSITLVVPGARHVRAALLSRRQLPVSRRSGVAGNFFPGKQNSGVWRTEASEAGDFMMTVCRILTSLFQNHYAE